MRDRAIKVVHYSRIWKFFQIALVLLVMQFATQFRPQDDSFRVSSVIYHLIASVFANMTNEWSELDDNKNVNISAEAIY